VKLAISNIAWSASEEPSIAKLLMSRGLTGVEIAPPRVWPHPAEVDPSELRRYKSFWQDHGIEIVALQSMLFGRTDLVIFGSEEQRSATVTYLKRMIDMAAELGAKVLVFGSPKNRNLDLDHLERTNSIAKEFFSELGEYAVTMNVSFCIEPNSKDYGCDFVNTTAEGLALVTEVGTSGFALHLDAGVLTLNSEDALDAISSSAKFLRHFHISEPFLNTLGSASVAHEEFSQALKQIAYANRVSIEMRPDAQANTLQRVDAALTFALGHYGL
jgi:D-psicose/D-tagatose/L-ribulose 3-epimerase